MTVVASAVVVIAFRPDSCIHHRRACAAAPNRGHCAHRFVPMTEFLPHSVIVTGAVWCPDAGFVAEVGGGSAAKGDHCAATDSHGLEGHCRRWRDRYQDEWWVG